MELGKKTRQIKTAASLQGPDPGDYSGTQGRVLEKGKFPFQMVQCKKD